MGKFKFHGFFVNPSTPIAIQTSRGKILVKSFLLALLNGNGNLGTDLFTSMTTVAFLYIDRYSF
jgi:hypothetical protein